MTNIEKALHWEETIIQQTDEHLLCCSDALKVELIKRREFAVTALAALQEKLARDSGCGHCQSSKVIFPKFGGSQFYIEMCGNEITLWDDCVCVAGFGVRHCPMCGSKLGGK